MKKNILIALFILFLCSCRTPSLTKEELNWNYWIIDNIVQNPDSLNSLLRNPKYSRIFSSDYDKEKEETDILIPMIAKKIKDNHFRNGYSITEEKIEHNDFFIHSMFIKSNETGKRIFIEFDSYSGYWEIVDIHTIIISRDSILEY